MVPDFVKKIAGQNPALADYFKSKYDQFLESPNAPAAIGRKRLEMLREVQKIAHLSVGHDISVNIGGFQFFIEPTHSTTSVLLANPSYETEETEFAKHLIRPEYTVIDMGANFGWYTIHFAKWAARVFSFEPIPSTFDELKRNVVLNHANNVTVVNQAVGETQGKIDFYLPRTLGGSALASEHSYFGKKVEVSMTTLDAYAAAHDIKPNFIKADIEGGELAMLRGAVRTIERFHPDLFLEIEERHAKRFGYAPSDIMTFMKHRGYSSKKVGSVMFYFAFAHE